MGFSKVPMLAVLAVSFSPPSIHSTPRQEGTAFKSQVTLATTDRACPLNRKMPASDASQHQRPTYHHHNTETKNL
ncbi:hypothetical protein M432DRAFT_625174, partial [Thermoascus aurantiacus ATCC 26904]